MLNEFIKEFRNAMQEFRQRINKQIDQIELHYYDMIQPIINEQNRLNEILHPNLEKSIKIIRESLQMRFNQIEVITSPLVMVNRITEELCILQERCMKPLRNLNAYDFSFDQEMIHENVLILNPHQVIKQLVSKPNERKSAYSIMVPALPYKQRVKFGFKILNCTLGVAVGMCEYKTIKNNGFQQGTASKVGHGYYFLCDDGRSYNTMVADQNDKQTSFIYAINDEIHVTYCPANNILKFKNMNTGRRQVLNYIYPDNTTLHPACSFLGTNDEIQFIPLF